MSEKLAACWHCRSTDVHILDAGQQAGMCVYCEDCGARGPMTLDGADEATRLWNTPHEAALEGSHDK